MTRSQDDRSRSRSPHRRSQVDRPHRSREDGKSSSHRHHHRHHHHERKPKKSPSPVLPPRPIRLPHKAQDLTKYDLAEYRPLLASYLDIQKQLYIEDLAEEEVKGRWKSFTKKWNTPANSQRNRGELAEGWYDPETKQKAIDSAERTAQEIVAQPRASPDYGGTDEEEEDEYGPVAASRTNTGRASGPSAATFSDLALRGEQRQEEAAANREDLRYARKLDRTEQKNCLDELVPRADAGTRERQLEKKRDAAAVNREFRDARGGGDGVAEVAESDLMGTGGGVDDVRGMRKEEERKKNERELRREEIMRARALEREERMAVVRQKEDKTMEMLKAIAKERFG